MGMIANYQQIADEKLQELKNSTDLFENIEDLQENGRTEQRSAGINLLMCVV